MRERGGGMGWRIVNEGRRRFVSCTTRQVENPVLLTIRGKRVYLGVPACMIGYIYH